jgi:dipeptidase D
MCPAIKSLVESSANLGTISSDEKNVYLTFMNRSSVESIMDDICLRFGRLAKLAGAEISHSSRYPGWKYNRDSNLQLLYLDTCRRLFGERSSPKISAIHAGLECGIIKKKLGDIDIIAVGPEINNIHTPDEEMNLKSCERLWRLINEILKQL